MRIFPREQLIEMIEYLATTFPRAIFTQSHLKRPLKKNIIVDLESRVDPREDDGSLRLDSDIAKRLGLCQRALNSAGRARGASDYGITPDGVRIFLLFGARHPTSWLSRQDPQTKQLTKPRGRGLRPS